MKTRSVNASGAGNVVAPLVPKGTYAARLRSHHRGFTTVKVSFQPTAGPTLHYSRRVRLVKH